MASMYILKIIYTFLLFFKNTHSKFKGEMREVRQMFVRRYLDKYSLYHPKHILKGTYHEQLTF